MSHECRCRAFIQNLPGASARVSSVSRSASRRSPATHTEATRCFLMFCALKYTTKNKTKVCRTNLKLPHQKQDEGSVDGALDDKNTVGEFGRLCDPQVLLCRGCKRSHELIKNENKYIQPYLLKHLYLLS